MRIYYYKKFEREFKNLPKEIQHSAIEKEGLFRKNPRDPRLDTHKLHGELAAFWSFSITKKYRVIFEWANTDVWFYSIGDHDIYKRK